MIQITNKKFAETEDFKKKCEFCKVIPTKRQASKYRNKRGIVYKTYNKI